MAATAVEQEVNAVAAGAAAPVARGAGPWSPRYRALTAGLLMTIAGMAFETLAVATVLPATAADLQGLGLYGAAFSAFLLTNLVGIVVAGILADRRGPAFPFLVGIVLFVAGLLVGGLAPTMPVLVLGRALQGFGGGAVGAAAYVALGRAYPEAAKPQMLAYLSTAWVVPGLVGPGVAGLLAETVGWRWAFLGLTPLPLLAVALTLSSLRRIPAGTPGPGDRARVVAAALLAVGAGLLLAGLGQGNLLPALALAVIGLGLSVPALRGLLPDGTLVARPGLPAAVLTMALLNLAFFGVDAFLPLLLVDVRGRSIAFAGLAFTAATITWTAGSWLQARFVGRASRRALIRSGIGGLTLGAALFTATLSPAVPAALAVAAWGVAGLGMGLAYSTLSLVVLENATAGQEGEASASLQLASVFGSGLGAGIGGALINGLGHGAGGLATALLVQNGAMMALLLATLLVAARLPIRAPVVGTTAPAAIA